MNPAKNKAQQLLRRKRIGARELARATGVQPSAAHRWLTEGSIPRPEFQKSIRDQFPDVIPELWRQKATRKSSKAVRPANSTNVETPGSELSLRSKRAQVRLTLRRHAADLDALVAAQSERERLTSHPAFDALRRRLAGVVEAFELEGVAVYLAPTPQPALDAMAGELGGLRDALAAMTGEATAAGDLVEADRFDAARARATKLLGRLAPSDVAGMLESEAWKTIVAGVAGLLRDNPAALEGAKLALVDDASPFGASLRTALESVRNITWPAIQYQDDPIAFFREVLGFEPYDKQSEIVELVLRHDQVAVRSGHRVGKSHLLAALSLWWFCSFPESRVLLTAPTDRQLQHVLWRSIRELIAKSGRCITCKRDNPNGPKPCPHSQRIDARVSERATAGLTSPDGLRQIIGFTSASTEGAAGFAAPNMLVIADECSGLEQSVLDALAGNRAGAGSKFIAMGNPTRASGPFYAMHTSKSKAYATMVISSLDSPNYREGRNVIPGLASREFVERAKLEHGEDSPFYRVRVLGEFTVGEDGKLFPLAIILDAQERWHDAVGEGPLVIGVDCAAGLEIGDRSAFCVRRGSKVLSLESAKVAGPEAHLLHVVGLLRTYRTNPRESVRIVVDADGALGTTIASYIEGRSGPLNIEVVRYMGHIPLPQSNQYATRRDECIAYAAQWLKSGGAIPVDPELEEELNLFALEVVQAGRFDRTKVTDKKAIRKALRRSSDKADAFALAVWNGEERAQAVEAEVDELDDFVGIHDPYAAHDAARVFDPYAGLGRGR
jgi:hypothetical protein